MGYRSDVTIGLYPRHDKRDELWPLVKLWVQENWPKDWCDIDYQNGGTIAVIRYTDVKWYDDHDFVKEADAALERFVEVFDCEDYENHRASYDFVRIGEETTDIDTRHTCYTDYRVGVRCEAVVD